MDDHEPATTNAYAPRGWRARIEALRGRRAGGGQRSMEERRADVTRLLKAGPQNDELLPIVYDEMRVIARKHMAGERADHTLQATALVHEAYVRLVGDEHMQWRDRRHFYAAAAEAMRRVLIDHARRVRSLKRGGEHARVTLGAPEGPVDMDADQILALDDAIEKLAAEDERAAAVTRLRFFSGLSVEETARVLEISERSVHREWTYARARLAELLGDD